MAANVPKLKNTLQTLAAKRTNIESTWDQIERYVMPLTGKVQTTDPNLTTDIEAWDFTASLANEHLAAALAGSVVPSSTRWFAFEFQDPDLRKDQAALAYLEKLTEMTWTELRNSDFAMEIGAGLLEYTGIGNMGLVVEPTATDVWDGVDFTCIPAKQYHFVEDSKGGIEQFFRLLSWTPIQIRDRCTDADGNDVGIPETVRSKLAAGGDQALQELKVIFAIWKRRELTKQQTDPRNERGGFLPVAPERRAFGYVYFLEETGEVIGQEGGYYEMPAVVGRWAKTPGTSWGFGRGNQALRACKYLNKYLESARAAAEKVVDPATMVTERGLLSDLNLRPGGLTVAKSKEDAWVHESGARFDVSGEVIRDTRNEIRRLFHEDDLQLKESPAMTATEVQARRDLMDRSLGAPVGRLQNDVLSPLLNILLAHLRRAGKLPEVPATVKAKKAEVSVSYYGAISRAQRIDEVASIERGSAYVASLVKSDPEHFGEAADVFDPVQAVREVFQRLGTPAMVLKSEEVVKQEREAKNKALAAQQQAELAQTQAGAAKDAASAMATLPAPPAASGAGGLTFAPQQALLPQTGLPGGM